MKKYNFCNSSNPILVSDQYYAFQVLVFLPSCLTGHGVLWSCDIYIAEFANSFGKCATENLRKKIKPWVQGYEWILYFNSGSQLICEHVVLSLYITTFN